MEMRACCIHKTLVQATNDERLKHSLQLFNVMIITRNFSLQNFSLHSEND